MTRIVYLDTSSLVKLYVEEEDSPVVQRLVEDSTATGTSLVAYAEARAAFARRFMQKSFTAPEYRKMLSAFQRDWQDYLRVRVTEELVMRAGDLAEKHGLNGFDAVHLSSAMTLRKESNVPVLFSCSDSRLQRAALDEKLLQP
jgi:predicted nucleic acid-binding protein